jgi:hypothetical protein
MRAGITDMLKSRLITCMGVLSLYFQLFFGDKPATIRTSDVKDGNLKFFFRMLKVALFLPLRSSDEFLCTAI